MENEKLVSDNAEVTNCLNNFSFNILQNSEIPNDEVKDNLHQIIKSPALKAVLKCRKHPSIISI